MQIKKEEEASMSIKNAIKRLENQVAKSGSGNQVTFIIPYNADSNQTRELQQRLIRDHNLENSDTQIIFVINFASAA